MNPARRQRGFTLLELSIALLIIALVTGMGFSASLGVLSSAKLSATYKKMAQIDNALMAYRLAQARLPCPADLTINPGTANFGVEGATPGTCTGGSPSANHSAAGITNSFATAAEGAVPVVTLGLPNDDMVDGWGNRFRYAVDVSMTAYGAFANTPAGCTNGAITVNDTNGGVRTTAAIYALISHGANGHGAYSQSGGIVNAGSNSADELTNCHCTSAGAYNNAYAPTYVQKLPQYDSGQTGNPLYYFDDLVSFKERWQMRTDLDTATCTYIYVTDSGNNRVQKFNASGSYIMGIGAGYNGVSGTIGSSGTGNGKFSIPIEVAIDSSGNIFVADYTNERVEKFNSSGTYLTQFGNTCCAGSGEFQDNPTALILDSSGNVYAGDICSEASVNKYNNSGSFIIQYVFGNTVFNCQGEGDGIGNFAMDSGGNIWATDTDNGGVHKINSAGSIVTTIGAGNGTGKAKFNYLGGVALDSSGNLWITDQFNNRIQKLSSSGTWLQTIPSSCATSACSASTANGSFNQPAGIAIDSSGNLWIADFGNNRVQELNSSGSFLMGIGAGYNGVSGSIGSSGTASGQFKNPSGIAIFSSSR